MFSKSGRVFENTLDPELLFILITYFITDCARICLKPI
jgi:hypothetical protein